MSLIVPVPDPVRRMFEQHGCDHPGLLLDRYVACLPPPHANTATVSFSEEVQKPTIQRVVQQSRHHPRNFPFDSILDRWRQMLRCCRAVTFTARTEGPMTLHLARASALENAGICLHALYGFPVLPGSGLKGLARAYAETVWFPGQYEKNDDGSPRNNGEVQKAQEAWGSIERIFGWSPNSDQGKTWKPAGIQSPEGASSGTVVFYDAWPTRWTPLIEDILNNHHPKYYQENTDANPPGDFENPVPVYFLAVDRGAEFLFAAGPRTTKSTEEDIRLALSWLIGGLTRLGAGAKTASGYGRFCLSNTVDESALRQAEQTWTQAISLGHRAQKECSLELVTPAFLAGPRQEQSDCRLREATLRGLLRWWWRTMHAGFLPIDKLHELEGVLWGHSSLGGAIDIALVPDPHSATDPLPAPFKKMVGNKLLVDEDFVREFELQRKHKTMLPLNYAAYGMDEIVSSRTDPDKKERRQRWCLWPEAKWTITLTARPRQVNGVALSAKEILDQALAALWLLCHFGGAGSKCRKGFGSFRDPPELREFNVEKVQTVAKQLRDKLNLPNAYRQDYVLSPSLEAMRVLSEKCLNGTPYLEIHTPWRNPVWLLNEMASLMMDFAQDDRSTGHGKHCDAKAALGLPRKIHGPLNRPLPHQNPRNHQPPKHLYGPRGNRLASPVFYHIGRSIDGKLIVRVAAFPIPDPLGITQGEKVLCQLLKFLKDKLNQMVANPARIGQAQRWPLRPKGASKGGSTGAQPIRSQSAPQAISGQFKAGQVVKAELLARTSSKGTRYARIVGTQIEGPIVNTADLPANVNVGDQLDLTIQSPNPTNVSFRWNPPRS
ncbi:MAG: hypothetical protein KatS3mg110_3071 [Pirellulaceae bacterium]|nr:MAG: hypothetical protein KatS3mg110_3071 [Pirellulaceae bacterium]